MKTTTLSPFLSAVVAIAIAGCAAAAPYHAPLTEFGVPDLEGVWTPQTATPLERSSNYAGLVATPAELAARRSRQAAAKRPPPPAAPAAVAASPPASGDGDVGQEGSEFADADAELTRIDGGARTSLIVDPADGKLPYTAAGLRLAEAAHAPDPHAYDGPENRPASERCLAAPNGQAGPPVLSGPDDANIQIFETPTTVGVLSEMIHDMRLVRMGGTHPAVRTHPLMGDSVGRWEGDTLVIETVDQSPLTTVREVGGRAFVLSPDARVTERFRRISPTEVLYGFTVEDRAVYTRAWRAEAVLRRIDKPVYEYACHEGNYALANILSGARAKEKTVPPPAPTPAAPRG